MRFLYFLVLQVCVCSVSMCYAGGSASSFHVLIVHEKKTEQGLHEIDAKNIKTTIKSIGKAIGRPVHILQMECKKASMGKIRKWCSTIKTQDTAIVYYSGQNPKNHMYNGVWPLITIGKRSVPVDLIANEVHARNARLSLVFADCYNKSFDAHAIIRRYFGSPLKKVKEKRLIERLKTIWLSEKGTLTMCSNKQGDMSYGMILNKKRKCVFGVFTEALLMHVGGRGNDRPRPVMLSELPEAVYNHILQDTCFTPTKQYSFYQSTITGIK